MAEVSAIRVEVAYARPDLQRLMSISVPAGTTARQAVRLSGLAAEFSEIDADHCPVGVFGNPVSDDHALTAGDRVEIYRPLQRDPRAARRALAARGLTMADAEGLEGRAPPTQSGSTGTSR